MSLRQTHFSDKFIVLLYSGRLLIECNFLFNAERYLIQILYGEKVKEE